MSSESIFNKLAAIPNATSANSPFQMPRAEAKGLYYKHKRIVLDGYTFIGCRFDNCTLETSSSNFDLIDCHIDPGCSIVYSDRCANVIRLFLSRYEWAARYFPNFFLPTVHPDGAISIQVGQK